MSLYNMVHGVNPLAGVLLNSLDFGHGDIKRLRDAALYNKDLKDGEYLIRIITRTGGPNRSAYQDSIDKLTTHPAFIRIEDDSYDSTYMYAFFRLPDYILAGLKEAVKTHPELVQEAIDNKSIKEKTDSWVEEVDRK
jgi:hypothetical protein